LQKIETENAETKLIIYLDNLGSSELCIKVAASRVIAIQDLKDALVKIYDYYDESM
jgi:predicted ATP-grasp superfamily ATP-dependent carboligase